MTIDQLELVDFHVTDVKSHVSTASAQELALSAAKYISTLGGVAVFSVGSDGTDGPTDAAGGYVDGETYRKVETCEAYLENNDSYNALKKSGGLIFTGPTGTNVNDFAAIIIK